MELEAYDLIARKEGATCKQCDNYCNGWCRVHLKQMRYNEAGYCFRYEVTRKFSFYDVLSGKVSPSLVRKVKCLKMDDTTPQKERRINNVYTK